jgi:hypothetical protein
MMAKQTWMLPISIVQGLQKYIVYQVLALFKFYKECF